jgi:hypothetical protein
MTAPIPAEQFAQVANLVEPHVDIIADRGPTFDLPPLLYGLTIGAYIAYLGVMSLAFMEPQLVLPMIICVLTVVAAFLTPGLWAGVETPAKARQSWNDFAYGGFQCMTGRVSGGSAALQVLILPGLILLWGVAIAIIAASVR